MENVISEFKIVETEDGFRIEIKGDKDKIRTIMGDFDAHTGRRWWRRPGPWAAHGFHPMMWWKTASCWGPWDYGVEADEEIKEA